MSGHKSFGNIVSTMATLAGAAVLVLPASASATHSVGTSEQVAWVRRAASNFVAAELADNAAGACGILNAPLRASERGGSCGRRWQAKLAKLVREPAARERLREQARAIPSAVVIVHGNTATLELRTSLMDAAKPVASNRFTWTENCWMLDG